MNAPNRDLREIVREEPVMRAKILAAAGARPAHHPRDRGRAGSAQP